MDALEENMEDNEGVEEKEKQNLGKLQFSLDYDFTKGEVNDWLSFLMKLSTTINGLLA